MRTTAFVLLLAATAPAGAQVDTSEWLCELCPFDEGYRADYEIGAISVSDEAGRFGNATGLDEDGVYPDLDGAGHYASNGYQLEWQIEDLGLDSRALAIAGGRQGAYDFNIGYRALPYRLFDTTQSIFGSNAAGVLTLPSGWVTSGTTGGMTALDASLRQRGIESDRQVFDLGGRWIAGERWRAFADFRRQAKEGIDIFAGAGFSQAALLPRNHDYETDQLDAGIQYLLPRGSVSLAWYVSRFDNLNDRLAWQSPFTSLPGASQPQLAEPPDNTFQQLSLSGHYRFEAWSSVIALSAASGSGEQDQDFLPYTVNAGIATSPLPRSNLDGSVDTTNLAATWTARPLSSLRLKAAYRYDERDNTTPREAYTRVIVDLVDSGEAELNTPFSFERSTLNLSADWRVLKQLRIGAGYDYKTLDRDFQEVAEQTEDTGWGQLRWQPVTWADLKLKGGTSRRDIDRYDLDVAQSAGQNPLLRKYNLAYRYREFVEVAAWASIPDLPLSFAASLYRSDDSFSRSVLGMTDAAEDRLTFDMSWAVNENTSAYLMIGGEDIEASQLGSANFGSADWSAAHDDRFDLLGAGIAFNGIADRLDLRFDYTRSDGRTYIVVDTDAGGTSQLPTLESSLESLRIEAAYRQSDRMHITATFRYEDFSSEDWAIGGVDPATIPSVLSLGADPYKYDLWLVGVGVRYRFGDRDISLRK